jgi:hypothetical protein
MEPRGCNRWQAVASSGKSNRLASRKNTAKLLPRIATSCRSEGMVRRGLRFGVRKRALDMPANRGLRFTGGLARSVECGYARAISSLFAPSTRIRLQTAKKASASWNRAKTFTAMGPSGIEGVASRS